MATDKKPKIFAPSWAKNGTQDPFTGCPAEEWEASIGSEVLANDPVTETALAQLTPGIPQPAVPEGLPHVIGSEVLAPDFDKPV